MARDPTIAGTEPDPAGVDVASLHRYLAGLDLGFAPERPLRVTRIEGGRSNLTFTLADGVREWILRRPPLGHVLPTAHDMSREYRVLSALAGTDVPAPRPLLLCEDPSVVGAPFYVMERVEGWVLSTAVEAAGLTARDARRACEALVDVLVRIHTVDHERAGLAGWGRADGYLERQVRCWSQQWERSKTRELPAVDELVRRLAQRIPEQGPAGIVHGDYRFDNVIFAPGRTDEVAAVIDWEMSTVGDPLADVGLLLTYWDDGAASRLRLPVGDRVTTRPGFLTRAELTDEYARRSGRDLSDLGFYVALGHFKLAVVLEGIHARFLRGQTVGEGFETFGGAVPALVEGALELVPG